ncbi:cell wall hydrolase [Sphingobium subterraneum]|uniref:Spore germination cell wall hydrolase CwlJ-like protein n=1 Tax=Sphingobium subterraneum TaxID=627688 RepID=A0A841IYA2_9SPHN|nr:cell wall hydrolase [Sphingobium subterraneum]MBB6123643.1 spore germination cell wall hydrolase CwlJ-like protein [Sphingobium subterraneum]
MTGGVAPPARPRALDWVAGVVLFVALPIAVAWQGGMGTSAPAEAPASDDWIKHAPSPPPKVDPLVVREVSPDDARAMNAAMPFSTGPNPAARPFRFTGGTEDRDRAIACLAAAQYYEAGDDPVGQKAVAQVVLNRVRHPAFPKSVCGVVFQGSERTTGCQFTFTCDGALARTPSPEAWDRARTLATRMLGGLVDRKVGYATHYHTDWVVPYWNTSLDKITEVHTHLFYRWQGWWGTPPAFRRSLPGVEPRVPMIARLSPVHEKGGDDAVTIDPAAPPSAVEAIAHAPIRFVAGANASSLMAGLHVIATSPADDAFIVTVSPGIATKAYRDVATLVCSGRPACRVMAWPDGPGVPTGFPIEPGLLSGMIFSYMHDMENGLQRMLWNCTLLPQPDNRMCMRERIPMGSLLPGRKPIAADAAKPELIQRAANISGDNAISDSAPPSILRRNAPASGITRSAK